MSADEKTGGLSHGDTTLWTESILPSASVEG